MTEPSTPVSRRRFLARTTAVAGLAVVAAACEDDTGTGAGRTAGPDADLDLDLAAVAAGLEKLAVDTYTAAGNLATRGRLGAAVPPAVTEFFTTAAKQHQEHLDTWNRVLTAGGRPAVTAPDAGLRPTVDAAVARLTDIPGAAGLALRLEDYAAQTYLKAIPTLESQDAIRTAAQILVVDQQHQAILRYVLGLHPVGSGVGKETKDFAPSDPSPALLTS